MNFEIAPKEYEIQANWYEARMYCFALDIDGKVGWRLPTKDELNLIYLTKKCKSENDFEIWYYWSSTEINDNDAWAQGFYHGFHNYMNKSDGGGYVRAIRDR